MTYSFNNFPHLDARSDLGYGTYDKFHKSSIASATFPYIEDNFEEDEFDLYDEEFLVKMINKIGDSKSKDHMSYKSADAGSQKDFMSKMNRIGEVSSHMSPIPDLYKNRSAVSGGTYPATTRGFIGYSEKTRPTGSKKGWAQSMPKEDYPENDKNLKKIKELIRLIHLSQEEE